MPLQIWKEGSRPLRVGAMKDTESRKDFDLERTVEVEAGLKFKICVCVHQTCMSEPCLPAIASSLPFSVVLGKYLTEPSTSFHRVSKMWHDYELLCHHSRTSLLLQSTQTCSISTEIQFQPNVLQPLFNIN